MAKYIGQAKRMKAAGIAVLLAGTMTVGPRLRAQSPGAGTDAAKAAVQAAKSQLQQDEAVYKSDLQAARVACKSPGAACDAAKAKVRADRAVLKTDKEAYQKAWQSAGGRWRKPKAE